MFACGSVSAKQVVLSRTVAGSSVLLLFHAANGEVKLLGAWAAYHILRQDAPGLHVIYCVKMQRQLLAEVFN